MNEQLNIIITGDNGRTLRLPCTKKKLLIYSTSAVTIIALLTVAAVFSLSLFTRNQYISRRLHDLQQRVAQSDQVIAEHQRKAKEEKMKLNLQLAHLKLDKAHQAAAFKEEKDQLLSTAISELNERSELIKKVMDNIGIKVSNLKNERPQNSGGPFISLPPDSDDELIYKADAYLKTIRSVPLGLPLQGHLNISSRFGPRIDPINGKRGFHPGVDLRGRVGDKVRATASGVVIRAGRNGGYGKYVEISHGNGYKTAFGHLSSIIVKRGDRVKRGQLIGLMGDTGRSTGPHLHYEVLHHNKVINPLKFLEVAKLLQAAQHPAKK